MRQSFNVLLLQVVLNQLRVVYRGVFMKTLGLSCTSNWLVSLEKCIHLSELKTLLILASDASFPYRVDFMTKVHFC